MWNEADGFVYSHSSVLSRLWCCMKDGMKAWDKASKVKGINTNHKLYLQCEQLKQPVRGSRVVVIEVCDITF